MATLEDLENELKVAASNQDHLEALDIYEEIEANEWTKPWHLIGLGRCLLRLRRRQDAKEAWTRAYLLDNNYKPAIRALNEVFPGWKKTLKKDKPPTQTVGRPQPVAPSAPSPPKPAAAPPPPPPPPQPKTEPKPAPKPAPKPPPPPPEPAPVVSTPMFAESEINWDYVMADVSVARQEMGDDAPPAEPGAGGGDQKEPEFLLELPE